MQLPKNFLWVALACLFVIVMYTIVNQGGFLKQLSVNPDGVTIKFDQLKDVPSQELAERQSRLEQKITDINNTLSQTSRQSSAAANDAGAVSAPIAVNLTGRWSSDVGLFYLINQYDNVLSIQEFSPMYGITAVGQGQITGQLIRITYQTALNTQGNGVLNVSADGRTITGQFTDLVTGNTSSVTLFR